MTMLEELIIEVPLGRPATLDGALDPDEWAGAYAETLASGIDVYFMQAAGDLYVGLRTKPRPVTSICVHRGTEIAVLHASAAVGTAIYRPAAGAWDLVRGFSWACRDTTDSPEAQAERDEYFQKEGWVGTNGLMGMALGMEFRIAMPLGTMRLAIANIGAPDYQDVASWPAGLTDGSQNLQLLHGPPPPHLLFSPGQWAVIATAPGAR